MHVSSIIAILFIFVAVLIKKHQGLAIKRFFYVEILISMFGIFYFGWNYIVTLPILSSYIGYTGAEMDIGIGVFISGIVYFILPLLLCRKEVFDDYETEVLFDIALLFVPIILLDFK